MRNKNYPLRRAIQRPVMVMIGCCSAFIVMLTSCSNGIPAQRESVQAEEKIFAAKYSMVFFIHGDGNYDVHDTNGNDYKADEMVLEDAKNVALLNPEADVFIFHQKPKAHFLFLFPIHDGEFYYYHNGVLKANELYWRDQERSTFESEMKLYHQFHGEFQSQMMSMFLYFGHEIPEFDGKGYDGSYPEKSFTVNDLSTVLKEFTRYSAKFDLLSLATCYGGTPYTISTLGPYTHYIIASPENLHLSYFDLHALGRLDTSLQFRDISSFAKRFAEQAFDRLTNEVQTTVSIAVYDMNRVKDYLHGTYAVYDRTLNTLNDKKKYETEHCDCADLPEYRTADMNNGVEVLYRPARFGRAKQKLSHSGWDCLRLKQPTIKNELHTD